MKNRGPLAIPNLDFSILFLAHSIFTTGGFVNNNIAIMLITLTGVGKPRARGAGSK